MTNGEIKTGQGKVNFLKIPGRYFFWTVSMIALLYIRFIK